jgi:hypothetical protein
MDPLTMVGAWAAALVAIAGAMRMFYTLFLKAVRAAIREELARVWQDQDDIEARLSALELALQFVREQLDDLREMMVRHVEKR